MFPSHVRTLFWDVNADEVDPAAYPTYTIERVLEHGDEAAMSWAVSVFGADHIRNVLRASSSVSPRSATFWALVFAVPAGEVAALGRS